MVEEVSLTGARLVVPRTDGLQVGAVAGEPGEAEDRQPLTFVGEVERQAVRGLEAAHSRYSGWAMPRTWKPPSTKMTSPVVQAPRSEAR